MGGGQAGRSAKISKTHEHMDLISILHDMGVRSQGWAVCIALAATVVCAALVYLAIRKPMAWAVMRIVRRTRYQWDDLMFDRGFFIRLGLLAAPIVIRIGLAGIDWKPVAVISRLVNVWIVVAAVLLVSEILNGLNRIYESYSVSKDRPIKVFIQVVMVFFWCAAAIVVVGIFTDQSITALLAGLTAFAAVLMLIFKDPILGFAAGVQLSANHMLRTGDWIVMSGSGAATDGTVLEINLTTVKVQNWDMTITTIPTYRLVSESFTNWRGMEESQGRRIKRSVSIDVSTIHYLSEQELETLKKSALLSGYIERKVAELQQFNAHRGALLDERRLTNVGMFRQYLEEWLARHPDINLDMTHMVRQLQPTPTGLPLEIYCFTRQQEWVSYERVQDDIFDHVFAVIGLFGLRAFQYAADTVEAEPQGAPSR